MKALIVTLLLTVSVQAQSLADAARKERERRAHLKPVEVIEAEGVPASTGAQGESTQPEVEAARPQPPAVDSVKEWNERIRGLLVKIQALQVQETATELQINELNNQIFAPVIDQTTKDQALARLGEAREKLAALGLELSQTTQSLETIEIQGPL
jgi:TolA-binding protein